MHWPIFIFYQFLRLIGKLPLYVLHSCGSCLGWLLWIIPNPARRKAIFTLQAAFPKITHEERLALAQRELKEAGKAIFEVAKIWTDSPENTLSLIRQIHGEDLFQSALDSERGLIIAAPHLGCWEILNYYLASKTRLTLAYSAPKIFALEELLLKSRGAAQVEQVRADGGGVRTLYKRLKAGQVVGILPDHQPKRGEGEFAPFFGENALTMVLLSRLAERTGANVIFSFAKRLPKGMGFDVYFLHALPDIANPHLPTAVAALNRGVEDCVKLAMPQYQWHYKRYSVRPTGDTRNLYKN